MGESIRGDGIVTTSQLPAEIDAHLGGDSSHVIASMPRSLAQYGVLPENTAAQNAAGFLAAQASGYTNFVLPAGTYEYAAAAEGDWMMTFTGASNVRITGLDAVINDTTVFSNNGPLTGLFLFDGCTDCEVTGIQYFGPALASPSTLLGYQGATLVRAINQTDGVRVNMRAANCRYGVQTGEYGDPTKGQCKNFDVNIRGTMVGYALAMYYADGIRHDLDVDGVHRIAYIAGCNDVTGTARYQNQYIAQVAYVISDVLTSGTDAAAQLDPVGSATTSRGSSNINVQVQEIGSTVFQPACWAAGITLSRVDPCTYRNIRINVQVAKSTDTISSAIGPWSINSTAKSIWSRYATNWEPSIVLEDIDVQVNSDHSAQSVAGNTQSEIYISTYDTAIANSATVRNMRLSGTVKKRPGETRADTVMIPGLVAGAMTDMTHDGHLIVLSGASAPIRMSGSFNEVSAGGGLVVNGSPIAPSAATIATIDTSSGANMNLLSDGTTLIGGAGPLRKVTEKLVGMGGVSPSWAGAIPAGAVVVGVQTRVQTAITGATGYQVGVAGATNRYGDNLPLTVGSTSGIKSYLSTETAPRNYPVATDLVLSAIGGSFTAGAVRVVITYDLFQDPTS